jgi:PAS domain S-box-containing protein
MTVAKREHLTAVADAASRVDAAAGDAAARRFDGPAIGAAAGQLVQLFGGRPRGTARQRSVQASEQPYRDFLEAIGVAVYTTDAAGRITFFNEAAAQFWGRRPELGEEWCGSLRLFWSDGRPMRHDECPMAIALRENRPVRGYEAIAERPDGGRVAFVPYPTPLRDGGGRLIGAVNVLVDVTERRLAEEALRASAEALQASNSVKDEFLGLVSHELRTPVTTIFGNARLLRERGDQLGDAQRHSMIVDIADDSDRLLAIVENLLLLTKLASGSPVDLEPQVLAHVVRKSVGSFQRRHRGRDIDLSVEPRHLIVEMDRTYLDLLLENLLSNATKYSPETSRIEVLVDHEGDEARVMVRDRGIGLGDVDPERLFTAFFRTEEAKRHTSGIGVGLAVCRRMLEVQGGRIWAKPREGGGAEFGFALPLAEPSEVAADHRMAD